MLLFFSFFAVMGDFLQKFKKVDKVGVFCPIGYGIIKVKRHFGGRNEEKEHNYYRFINA